MWLRRHVVGWVPRQVWGPAAPAEHWCSPSAGRLAWDRALHGGPWLLQATRAPISDLYLLMLSKKLPGMMLA